MTSLSQVRGVLASSPYFVASGNLKSRAGGSVLPKLSSQGDLLAGAVTRVSVGFLLNPFSVLKARYEVCCIINWRALVLTVHGFCKSDIFRTTYQSFPSAFISIIRSGPSELFKGFIPSAVRDAPYAGIFVASYERIKREIGEPSVFNKDFRTQ